MAISSTYKDKLKFGFALFLGTCFIFFISFLVCALNSSVSENMDVLSWCYYVFPAFSQASIFALVSYILFYIPLSFLFKRKVIATSVFVLFAVVIQTILILDMFVFDIYKFHINGFVLELLFGGAATDIFVFDWTLYLKFAGIFIFFALLPFLLVVFISSKLYKRIKAKTIRYYFLAFLLSLVVAHLGYVVAHARKNLGIQKSATAIPLFFPLTANKLMTKWGIIKTDDLDAVSYNKSSSDIQYPIHEISTTDSIPNYNIVVIVVDSWNPSTFDSIVCPNMYSFTREKGQHFNQHLSSSNGTRGSIFGIFFGLSYTYEKEFYMAKMSPVFVDRLIDLNYNIDIFPSADFTSPPFHETIFRRVPGINTRGKGDTPFARDGDITKNFIDYIDKKDDNKPFYSFLFYDLPHAMVLPGEAKKPFQPSWDAPNYMSLNNNTDATPFFNLYKNCVHRTDDLVGQVLHSLEKKGLLENTLIVITGDHGQEFNENKKNYWGHNGNYSKWQIQVPLAIYYPGIEAGKTHTHATTHYDISPTLLHRFLGVQNPSTDYSMGFDLWNIESRFPHVVGDHVNYGFVLNNVIVTTDHIGSMNVTDLKMNNVPRNAIDVKELRQAIDKKNMFYKK